MSSKALNSQKGIFQLCQKLYIMISFKEEDKQYTIKCQNSFVTLKSLEKNIIMFT